MKTIIRYANADDIDALANIHSRSLRVAFKGIVPDDTLDNTFSYSRRKQGFTYELDDENPITAIAFDGDNEVGLLSFGASRYITVDEDTIELWRIYLIPEYWGSGIGEELFNWGMNEIMRKGYKNVILWVLEENTRARRFYEKHGFSHNGCSIDAGLGRNVSELLYNRKL